MSITPQASAKRTMGILGLEEDLLVSCVSCGLCLPHCPTYRATGEELLSPRGRITVMRAIEQDNLTIDDTIRSALDTCVMCRGCETACPSGVQFGRLMEDTRSVISAKVGAPPLWLRLGLRSLSSHRLLLAGSSALGLAQRLRIIPTSLSRRLGAPDRVAIRRPRLTNVVSTPMADAFLFTGCVMDAWQRAVHADALALMQTTGARVAIPTSHSCCGALHSHSGLTSDARKLAEAVIASCPGNAPVVVDSAGCGAALKDYGHLLGTDEAATFSARVVDISTWLAERIDRLGPAAVGTAKETVIVQDPCHLRHVQRTHGAVRTLLAKYVDLVELPDDGRCCGAGGAYSVLQPELATSIRDTKVAVILASNSNAQQLVVASGNPGCSMWLAQVGLKTEHPVTVVARHGRQAGWLHART